MSNSSMCSTPVSTLFNKSWLFLAAGASHASRKLLSNGCAAAFHQCGGETCQADGIDCVDSAYACCPLGYGCQRLTQLYWQCLPNTDKPGTSTALHTATNIVNAGHKSSAQHQLFLLTASLTICFACRVHGYRLYAAYKWQTADCVLSCQRYIQQDRLSISMSSCQAT